MTTDAHLDRDGNGDDEAAHRALAKCPRVGRFGRATRAQAPQTRGESRYPPWAVPTDLAAFATSVALRGSASSRYSVRIAAPRWPTSNSTCPVRPRLCRSRRWFGALHLRHPVRPKHRLRVPAALWDHLHPYASYFNVAPPLLRRPSESDQTLVTNPANLSEISHQLAEVGVYAKVVAP